MQPAQWKVKTKLKIQWLLLFLWTQVGASEKHILYIFTYNIKKSTIINLMHFEPHQFLAGQYRTIDDLVRNETQGAGSMELLSLKEIRDDETKIE